MIEFDTFSRNSNGGAEIAKRGLQKRLPQELLNKFQIVCDRVSNLDNKKIKLFWCHNIPEHEISNESLGYSAVLSDNGWKKFSKIIFVSQNQRDKFILKFNIPYSHCSVISCGIDPLENKKKR